MATFRTLERDFPASLAELEGVCLELRGFLAGAVLTDRTRFGIELLAREALSNAVRHGCKADPELRVRMSCRLGRRALILKVADDGPGFDWRAMLDRPADEEACHGRGLALYRLYANRFLFNQRGNKLVLIHILPEPKMPESTEPMDAANPTLRPGDLTATTVDRVRGELKLLLQGGAKLLTIDLAGVQMVDSMGIGLLIQAHNSLTKTGGSLEVVHASAELLELFRSMRLDKRFTIHA